MRSRGVSCRTSLIRPTLSGLRREACPAAATSVCSCSAAVAKVLASSLVITCAAAAACATAEDSGAAFPPAMTHHCEQASV
jgi:hypothetical protein